MAVKYGNREMDTRENEAHGPFCDCALCPMDGAYGDSVDAALRLLGKRGGKCHGNHNQKFQGMQVHKPQGYQKSMPSAVLKDGGTLLLNLVHHPFHLGLQFLTPLHPKGWLHNPPGATLRGWHFCCCLHRHRGLHPLIQSQLKLPFQSTRHPFPWKHVLWGVAGWGLRRAGRHRRLGKNLVNTSWFIQYAPPIHIIN